MPPSFIDTKHYTREEALELAREVADRTIP